MAELRLSLSEQTGTTLAQYLDFSSADERYEIAASLNDALMSFVSLSTYFTEDALIVPLHTVSDDVIQRVVRIVDTQLELSDSLIDDGAEPYEVLTYTISE